MDQQGRKTVQTSVETQQRPDNTGGLRDLSSESFIFKHDLLSESFCFKHDLLSKSFLFKCDLLGISHFF